MIAGDECAEKLPLTPGQIQRRHIQVVAPEWLEECLAQGRKVDEEKYRVHLEYCCDSGVPDLNAVVPKCASSDLSLHVQLGIILLHLGSPLCPAIHANPCQVISKDGKSERVLPKCITMVSIE